MKSHILLGYLTGRPMNRVFRTVAMMALLLGLNGCSHYAVEESGNGLLPPPDGALLFWADRIHLDEENLPVERRFKSATLIFGSMLPIDYTQRGSGRLYKWETQWIPLDGNGTLDTEAIMAVIPDGNGMFGLSFELTRPSLPAKAVPAALLDQPASVSPLFIFGDLNEDGRVNGEDRRLMEMLIQEKPVKEKISCPAAADFDVSGVVDAGDWKIMAKLFADNAEEIGVPTLFGLSNLPCSYRQLLIAAKLDGVAGERVPIRFLDSKNTVENATVLSIDEYGEVHPAEDGRGYELFIKENAEPGSVASVYIKLASGTGFIYSLPIISPPIFAGGDPSSGYSDTMEASTGCPHRGDCVALIIDFSRHIWYEFDADEFADALKLLPCEVQYVAPRFTKVPPNVIRHAVGVSSHSLFARPTIVTVYPNTAAIKKAKDQNAKAWSLVRREIDAYRRKLSEGADIAIEMIRGHGDMLFAGTKFHSGSSIKRSRFHLENYRKARRNVCSHISHDLTCKAGMTPKILGSLNNSKLPSASSGIINHDHHAGYEIDVATGACKARRNTTNRIFGCRISNLRQLAEAELSTRNRDAKKGRTTKGYKRLGIRFRNEAYLRSLAIYSDLGFVDCKNNDHIHSY